LNFGVSGYYYYTSLYPAESYYIFKPTAETISGIWNLNGAIGYSTCEEIICASPTTTTTTTTAGPTTTTTTEPPFVNVQISNSSINMSVSDVTVNGANVSGATFPVNVSDITNGTTLNIGTFDVIVNFTGSFNANTQRIQITGSDDFLQTWSYDNVSFTHTFTGVVFNSVTTVFINLDWSI